MKRLFVATLLSFFVVNLSAQDYLPGIWKTDKDNTLVRIEKQGDVFEGKVISSDDENIKPGTVMLKDVKSKKEKLEGKIYVPARDTWLEGTFEVSGDKLKITAKIAFISKSVVWTKNQ